MLTTTVLNLIFNLLFIVGLKLGVAGSAMGTVLAQLIGALLTLKLLDDKFHFAKCSGRIFNAKQIKNVLHIALPTTFQQFVVTFGGVLIQSFVNPFGREVIIGYVAILRIMNFFRIVLVGLAQTLTVYGAQLISARQFSGFKKVYRECSKIGLWYCALQAVVFVFFQNTLPQSSLMFQSIQKRSRFFRHTFWHSCSSRLQAFLNFKTKVCCVQPCK